jgi:hypothetical protein
MPLELGKGQGALRSLLHPLRHTVAYLVQRHLAPQDYQKKGRLDQHIEARSPLRGNPDIDIAHMVSMRSQKGSKRFDPQRPQLAPRSECPTCTVSKLYSAVWHLK